MRVSYPLRKLTLLASLLTILLLGAAWVTAQEVSAPTCAPALETLWTAASDACIAGPVGYICNGGAPPIVEPAGPVANALTAVGALVEVQVVDSIRAGALTPEMLTGGILWLRPPAPVRYTGLAVGEVSLLDRTAPDLPAWQSVVVRTGATVASTCGSLPRSAYVVQTPFGQPVNIAINGVSLGLNGTVLIQTIDSMTVFAGLSGQSSLYAAGAEQTLRPGQEILVGYAGDNFAEPVTLPSAPLPLDEALVVNFPVALLDRTIILPQPGYVSTDGAVNLRVAPSTDAEVLLQVQPGQVLSVLGQNSTGEWYHVRLDSGETGWMYAPLLIQNVGAIDAVYEATPLPPQRYGDIGRTATVVAPAGVNMRAAPDVSFPLVMTIPDGAKVTLLARSPYSPWVKVDFNGVIGWLALITLQTQAVLEALPIDNNVPPPPEPTRVPGSFGNAFPDPNKPGS